MGEFSKEHRITRKILTAWQFVGIILGIVSFKFNSISRKFEKIKNHIILTYSMGCLVVIGFPIANIRFFQSIDVVGESVKYSFSTIVSSCSDILTHLGVFFIYITVIRKNEKILELLNNFVSFENAFRKIFPRSKVLTQFSYRWVTITTIISNILIVVTVYITISTVGNRNNFEWYFRLLYLLPKFIALYTGNWFCFGIFWVKYQILKIQKEISTIKSYEKFYRNEKTKNCHVIQDELSKVSEIYHVLFDIFSEFQNIFALPMLLIVTSCFLSVMTQSYYASLITMFSYYDHVPEIKLILQLNGGVSLVLYLTDILINTKVCSSCTREVNSRNFGSHFS